MDKKKYIRDKRSPKPYSEAVSEVMSRNKAKDTTPELIMRKLLRENGLKGYRIHPLKIPGKPDICFLSKKTAIFINGCFWHRCPTCNFKLPKHNALFWANKFKRNITRDKEKTKQLKNLGWKVVTVWECQLKSQNLEKALSSVIKKVKG